MPVGIRRKTVIDALRIYTKFAINVETLREFFGRFRTGASFDELTHGLALLGLTPWQFLTDSYFLHMVNIGIKWSEFDAVLMLITARQTGVKFTSNEHVISFYNPTYDSRWSFIGMPEIINMRHHYIVGIMNSIGDNLCNPVVNMSGLVYEFITLMEFLEPELAHEYVMQFLGPILTENTMDGGNFVINVQQLRDRLSRFIIWDRETECECDNENDSDTNNEGGSSEESQERKNLSIES